MYPFKTDTNMPLNQWWVAALSEELGESPMERSIAGQRIVFYRGAGGRPVALAALCPHRHFPLVQGRRVGDELQCGYHGFRFDGEGRCTHVPSQRSVPSTFRTRSYPVVERGPWVWIWTGDAALADSSAIPDTEALGLGATGWRAVVAPPMPLAARYTLLIDNLLDLSHITFVHEKSIPGGEAVAYLPTEVQTLGTTIRLRRVAPAAEPNGLDRLCFPGFEGRIDTVTDSEYIGPCLIKTGGPRYASALEGSSRRLLGHLHFLHAVTPATPTTTHYFVATVRDFQLEDQRLDAIFRSMEGIGREDVAVLEQIEPALDKGLTAADELHGRVDAGVVLVRRQLEAQIAAESTG